MSELKRYSIVSQAITWEEEDKSGDWVKYEDVAKLQAELSRLREGTRWIDVNDRLPEEFEAVIVWIACPDLCEYFVTEAFINKGQWIEEQTKLNINHKKITHWKTLLPPALDDKDKQE